MQKITGEDLLVAIGDLPEKLLEYPSNHRTRALIFKKITIAASLILCISVVITFFLNSGLFSPKFDMDGSINDMNSAPPPTNGNDSSTGNSGSDLSDSNTSTIYIKANGQIRNYATDENNCLQIKRSSSNIIYISYQIDPSVPFRAKLYEISGYSRNEIYVTPGGLSSTEAYYTLTVTEDTCIDFERTQSDNDFYLTITVFDTYYLVAVKEK